MITSASQLLYSASAVRRMFRIASGVAVVVKEWAFVVWIWVKGQRPRFISKKAFKAHFVAFRRQQSQGLQVTKQLLESQRYTVRNLVKESVYEVYLYPDRISCSCDDFSNQVAFLGRGCCKHGYAVLSHCGFGSLAEYVAAQPQAA
jgi:hypothetical protein